MDSVGGVGVLDKAMSIIRALGESPASLQDLQRATGLPRATAHRLALALEAHGMVRRDSTGRFCLGFELIALGRAAAAGFPLAEVARPVMAALRDETGEGVQLYVREGDARRCVVSLQSPHGLRWIVPEGALLPLGIGSAGKVLAPADSQRREQSWVQSVEERERGVASVSAPVHDREGNVVAALSVSGPLERMTGSPGKRFGSVLVEAAAKLKSELL